MTRYKDKIMGLSTLLDLFLNYSWYNHSKIVFDNMISRLKLSTVNVKLSFEILDFIQY